MKKKPDAAARLLRKHLKITDADAMTEDEVALLSRIRRLIAREVKAAVIAERERCVAICRAEFDTARYKDNELYVGWRGAASAIQIKIAKGPK